MINDLINIFKQNKDNFLDQLIYVHIPRSNSKEIYKLLINENILCFPNVCEIKKIKRSELIRITTIYDRYERFNNDFLRKDLLRFEPTFKQKNHNFSKKE